MANSPWAAYLDANLSYEGRYSFSYVSLSPNSTYALLYV